MGNKSDPTKGTGERCYYCSEVGHIGRTCKKQVSYFKPMFNVSLLPSSCKIGRNKQTKVLFLLIAFGSSIIVVLEEHNLKQKIDLVDLSENQPRDILIGSDRWNIYPQSCVLFEACFFLLRVELIVFFFHIQHLYFFYIELYIILNIDWILQFEVIKPEELTREKIQEWDRSVDGNLEVIFAFPIYL